ncbi:MAG TPA: hypothetical protein VJK90_14740 [Acetobacteraceae bacterium]|jgi:hypothetical protein|nr:hypothetical protein [Acetobacteraceae bacterium]
MSTSRRAELARLAAFAARPNGRRITRSYAADAARAALFGLAGAVDLGGLRTLRGEA